jgi:hypothetical protein
MALTKSSRPRQTK